MANIYESLPASVKLGTVVKKRRIVAIDRKFYSLLQNKKAFNDASNKFIMERIKSSQKNT